MESSQVIYLTALSFPCISLVIQILSYFSEKEHLSLIFLWIFWVVIILKIYFQSEMLLEGFRLFNVWTHECK